MALASAHGSRRQGGQRTCWVDDVNAYHITRPKPIRARGRGLGGGEDGFVSTVSYLQSFCSYFTDILQLVYSYFTVSLQLVYRLFLRLLYGGFTNRFSYVTVDLRLYCYFTCVLPSNYMSFTVVLLFAN